MLPLADRQAHDCLTAAANRQPGAPGTEMVLKYQLPGHNMEELISLRTNEDLEEFKVDACDCLFVTLYIYAECSCLSDLSTFMPSSLRFI